MRLDLGTSKMPLLANFPYFFLFSLKFSDFSGFSGSRAGLSAPINTGFKKELIGALFLLVGLDS